jgi:hypothetical protein
LSFISAYTFSKALATADSAGPGDYYFYYYIGQDFYNRKNNCSVTVYNTPHDLKVSWIYDIPFGPQGKWLRSGVASKILGGWTVSAILEISVRHSRISCRSQLGTRITL